LIETAIVAVSNSNIELLIQNSVVISLVAT